MYCNEGGEDGMQDVDWTGMIHESLDKLEAHGGRLGRSADFELRLYSQDDRSHQQSSSLSLNSIIFFPSPDMAMGKKTRAEIFWVVRPHDYREVPTHDHLRADEHQHSFY